jgi:hypothetical protein
MRQKVGLKRRKTSPGRVVLGTNEAKNEPQLPRTVMDGFVRMRQPNTNDAARYLHDRHRALQNGRWQTVATKLYQYPGV